ncbi:hypothetical protein [Vibrio harveyi]|uniref:hypothetical protein n=1 Tax=Vibrio harveyi TaxID=669 RepID=UPI00068269B7|nr:hypothetical protein [Vibrio harveyi]
MGVKYSVNSAVKIKNAVGTGERTCKCGSWLNHWRLFSGIEKPVVCSVFECRDVATVGAHVTRPKAKNDFYKHAPYIVPMCRHHNNAHGETFDAKSGVVFVWANVNGTCGV